jgi:hypothetical protein
VPGTLESTPGVPLSYTNLRSSTCAEAVALVGPTEAVNSTAPTDAARTSNEPEIAPAATVIVQPSAVQSVPASSTIVATASSDVKRRTVMSASGTSVSTTVIVSVSPTRITVSSGVSACTSIAAWRQPASVSALLTAKRQANLDNCMGRSPGVADPSTGSARKSNSSTCRARR